MPAMDAIETDTGGVALAIKVAPVSAVWCDVDIVYPPNGTDIIGAPEKEPSTISTVAPPYVPPTNAKKIPLILNSDCYDCCIVCNKYNIHQRSRWNLK